MIQLYRHKNIMSVRVNSHRHSKKLKMVIFLSPNIKCHHIITFCHPLVSNQFKILEQKVHFDIRISTWRDEIAGHLKKSTTSLIDLKN